MKNLPTCSRDGISPAARSAVHHSLSSEAFHSQNVCLAMLTSLKTLPAAPHFDSQAGQQNTM